MGLVLSCYGVLGSCPYHGNATVFYNKNKQWYPSSVRLAPAIDVTADRIALNAIAVLVDVAAGA